MSTKITLSHDEQSHFYREIFDISNVYVEIEKHEYEVSNGRAMIQIPIKSWRKMVEAWQQSGWPKEEDGKENELAVEWLDSLEHTLNNIKEKNDKTKP